MGTHRPVVSAWFTIVLDGLSPLLASVRRHRSLRTATVKCACFPRRARCEKWAARRRSGLRSFPGKSPLSADFSSSPSASSRLSVALSRSRSLSRLASSAFFPAELVAPPVVRLLGDLQLTADVSDVLTLVQHPISGRQLALDLLRRVLLPRSHVDVEPSCPHRGAARLSNDLDRLAGVRATYGIVGSSCDSEPGVLPQRRQRMTSPTSLVATKSNEASSSPARCGPNADPPSAPGETANPRPSRTPR